MINPKLPVLYYGGDYNPEQWDEETWIEDMRLFRLANINFVRLSVFSWALIQPEEDKYEFSWLDRILDLIAENGIYACIATSTAAQPAWMSLKYPEILPVDVNGRKRTHGKRVNFCPNSAKFRELAAKLVRKLALRYKDHPSLLMWNIANEYGTYCYCETCAREFRNWAKERYLSIDELNKRWNLSFWGHTVYDWQEISVPSELNDDNKWYQPKALDYLRFMTDSNIACYLNEYRILKEVTPNVLVTTNISGLIKKLDQFKWADYVDIVAWDNYPTNKDGLSTVALKHDLMRALKNGQPYMLMEQTPSQQNWQPYNMLKRPGVLRLLSYQALAHGADTVLYFQLRRSIAGVEKFHGALIEHAGHENTRVFRECARIGSELKNFSDKILDSRVDSKIAIMFDWANWWAVELSSGPSVDLKYFEQVNKYYKALYDMNMSVDIVKPDADLSKYSLVIAPLLYMTKSSAAKGIEKYVEEGGAFVTTFLSGIVDENDRVILGGYPGALRKVLGVWVEEVDAILPEMRNAVVINDNLGYKSSKYESRLICEVVHSEGAEILGVYGNDFYAKTPCFTVNSFGKGKAYYIATDPEDCFISEFLEKLCIERQIKPVLVAPKGVEVSERIKDDKKFLFVLNHNDHAVTIEVGNRKYRDLISDKAIDTLFLLKPKDVAVLEYHE